MNYSRYIVTTLQNYNKNIIDLEINTKKDLQNFLKLSNLPFIPTWGALDILQVKQKNNDYLQYYSQHFTNTQYLKWLDANPSRHQLHHNLLGIAFCHTPNTQNNL